MRIVKFGQNVRYELKEELHISFKDEREAALYNAGYFRGLVNDEHMFTDAVEHCVEEYKKFTQKRQGKKGNMCIAFSPKEYYRKYMVLAKAVRSHLLCLGYNVELIASEYLECAMLFISKA